MVDEREYPRGISAVTRRAAARFALDITRACFSRPEAEAEFQEWLKLYTKKSETGGAES